MILATTFPTTSSRALTLQVSHLLRSPFFRIGTSKASDQSLDRSLSGLHDFSFIELALDKVSLPLLLLCYHSGTWVPSSSTTVASLDGTSPRLPYRM